MIVRDIIAQLPTEPRNLLETRPLSAISMLVVHWDGGPPISSEYDPLSYYKWEAQLHIDRVWDYDSRGRPIHGYGLAYHEVIDRDGNIWVTRPATHEVWAQTGANPIAYAVKLDATVHMDPTPRQLATLPIRLDALRRRYGLGRAAVFGHGELTDWGNQTQCPGSDLLAFVRKYRDR